MQSNQLRVAAALGALFALVALSACGGRGGGGSTVIPAASNARQRSGQSARSEFSQILGRRHLTDEGEASPDTNVHLLITLAHSNEAQLEQLVRDQETPGSANYLHFLTPQDFDAHFGAPPAARAQVEAALRKAGFQIDSPRFGSSVVEADGSVSQAETLFSTALHNVLEQSGRTAIMPSTAPVTPAELKSGVVAILGLDTTDIDNKAEPQTIMPCYTPPCPVPNPIPTPRPVPTVPGNQYPVVGPNQPLSPPPGYYSDTDYYNFQTGQAGYAPYTYAYDYDMPVQHGFGGSAQFPIGVIVDGFINDSDLTEFDQNMAVHVTGSLIRIGTPGGDQIETTNDIEAIRSLAPGANIYLYQMPNLQDSDIVSTMNIVVQQDAVAVVSMSIAGCENEGVRNPNDDYYEAASAEDSVAAQGSAEGITFIASTGDDGGPDYLSHCPSINAPAASSYVVAVGGTSPDGTTDGMPPDAYRPGFQYAYGESVPPPPPTFKSPCASGGTFCASNGGASTHFQTAEQLEACNSNATAWRCTPDISFAADFYHAGYMIMNGNLYGLNGTSFASPIFASIQAEIDQRQGTRKGNVVGRLYAIWRQYGYAPYASGQPAVFQDITAGNTGWQAAAGYDAATGIGSIDGWALSATE